MEIKIEKPASPIKEIILCDSGDEIHEEKEEEEIEILTKNKEKTNQKTKPNSSVSKKCLLQNALLRGLLPLENDDSYFSVLKFPVVKRCCIEHCYFARNRSKRSRYNFRNLPANNDTTLRFENENRLEQQTIDFESLVSEEVNSMSINEFVNENNIVNDKKKRNSISSSSDTDESLAEDSSDQDYSPEDNSTGTDSENVSVTSDESDYSIKQIWKKARSNLAKPGFGVLKNVPRSDERKNSVSRRRLGKTNYPTTNKIPNNFVSVRDLLNKIKNMQKLVKAKCDKKFIGDSGKTAKIPPPKLRKMNREKGGDFPKMSEYLFPMPNLTKMGSKEKNWRVEYMDDVQSLGLDDLLLKASELNAENFTKALGRKLDSAKPNFNTKDSSEIVFTIPKSKRSSVGEAEQCCESVDSEFSKRSNVKAIKLDISKPFFESGKVKEVELLQETLKTPEETSPKRPGIKVKTVENINEEFKDSLGLKNKVFQECSLNGADKEISSILENKKNLPSGNGFSNPMKDLVMLDTVEKEGRSQEEMSSSGADENRPFIMTIIQSKTEKQRPAILRNSSYFKKKSNNLESAKTVEKVAETTNEDKEVEPSSAVSAEGSQSEGANFGIPDPHSLKGLEKGSFNGLNLSKGEAFNHNSRFGKNFGSNSKAITEPEDEFSKVADPVNENRLPVKMRNIPFILNHSRKARQLELSAQGNSITNALNKTQLMSIPNKLVKGSSEGSDKVPSNEKTFKVTSIEQKVGPKEANRRFIKVVPYEPASNKSGKSLERIKGGEPQQKNSDEESEKGSSRDGKGGHILSLSAFSTILKEILPDKWFLCLDKKYGLQIIKTHLDEGLNPSILISVVIARCGKLTVNVRGKQLEKSHELFYNLCEIGNSENKLSINYVLAVLNKLRYVSVCLGCDDQSLKKYWCDDGFIEYHTELQQVYRSHLCQLLVSLGKKRCYPCYRMNESFKKRHRRDKLLEKPKEETTGKDLNGKEIPEELEESEHSSKNNLPPRGVKRKLEDFLEESFSTMKQQIADEIEKNKKLGERENAMKAQDEVLSFMGLARKGSFDNSVRKSKRKKNSFYKLQQPVKKKIDQQELEFLEKYWTDINTLFSTSLLFGAYSRTGRGRLREKCRMFRKLLSTWRNIVRSNPEWIGEIILPDELPEGEDPLGKDSGVDQFETMEVPALRAYIINSVKEVNRIKHKLRTRNSYFKILYNKFVKRRMKRAKSLSSTCEKKGTASSANSTTNTPTPTDFSSDESSRDKEKTTDDENRPINDLIMTCVSEGD